MEGSVSNESSLTTVPMLYIVACGNPTSDADIEKFEYSDQAPSSLCQPHGPGKPVPDVDELGMFLTTIINRYHPGILESRARRCVSCNKPARELYHSGLPFLSPGPGVLPGFKPTLWDTAVPICRSGGICDHHAARLAHDVAKFAFPEFYEEGKVCDCCGWRSGVKVCGGCRTLAYCSRECQEISWPSHRKTCRLARQERARLRAENNTSIVIA